MVSRRRSSLRPSCRCPASYWDSAAGPSLRPGKCELFSRSDLSSFPKEMRRCGVPNRELLGSPVGDAGLCARFIDAKRKNAAELLHRLRRLQNPQVALSLLRTSASFCRLAHIARNTPPDQRARNTFRRFDNDVRRCFEECLALETTDVAWCQAQLGLRLRGFGLRSLERHSYAAFIASLHASTKLSVDEGQRQLPSVVKSAITCHNTIVQEKSQLNVVRVASSAKLSQRNLSAQVATRDHETILEAASPADRGRLQAVAADHASAWMRAVPLPGLGLTISPDAMSVLTKCWLGLPVSRADEVCPRCRGHALEAAGHHALTCKRSPHVTARHNTLRDSLSQYCRRALLNPTIEAGAGLDTGRTRPADILLPTWTLDSPAALDLTVVHPLNSTYLTGANADVGSAALAAAAERKHTENDAKCKELGWSCVPVAVTTFGAWGEEADNIVTRVCERLALASGADSHQMHAGVRQRLSVILMRTTDVLCSPAWVRASAEPK